MRILVVDDEASVREAYRHIFEHGSGPSTTARSRALASELFSDAAPEEPAAPQLKADVTYVDQGLAAVEAVEAALAAGQPFQVAFIDIRMPPGIDGKETARRIRALDQHINLVIVTAYSDHSVTDIAAVAGPADKIFYICKPFAPEEILQMARALCKRWDYDTRQIEQLRDKVAALAASEARALHIANHDFLTGAPNRMAFQRELNERLRLGCERLHIAFVDLDRFKHVNDTFGHAAGDDLLVTIFQRLREASPLGAMIARLGGDEFGLFFEADSDAEALKAMERIVDTCTGTFTVFGNSVQIGASCGLVDCGDHPDRDVNDLLRFADLALFSAKRGGRAQVRSFDAELDLSQQFRQTIETGLNLAIARDELRLHYQPIVERESLQVVGYEALLRWTSRDHGEIPPGVFIPIAEESTIIHRLGDWVIERALSDARSWPDKIVSINFSPRQFKAADFAERLVSQASRFGVAPERIQVEITETALFQNVERASDVLAKLRERGFLVALDDFGTGYSSMFNLKSFTVDCIKIDRSFVSDLGRDRQSAAIVSAITQLARGLGMTIVAEGVENDGQAQMLRLVGCSHMQGYMFGKAQPVEDIPAGQVEADRRAADG